jgi:LacI family transcriptional regulator
MRDVAQMAGVSMSTVSHVVNKTRYVSPELRQRVLSAMERLDYRPNTLARSLRRGISHTIGLITPDNSNPAFAEFSRTVETVGFGAGYSVILCNSDGQLEKELAYINVLLAQQIAGIIFIAASSQSEHIALITEHDVPVVIADRQITGDDADEVLVDNYKGGCLAAEHLLGLGHQRIGCITGRPDTSPSAERVRGYRDTLEAAGLRADESLIVKGNFRYDGGADGARQLLHLERPPSAIFACNDAMAIAAMASVRQMGLSVPDDMSIVGFDDIAMASYTSPPLTTVVHPFADMARVSTELLIEKLSGSSPGSRRKIVLDVKLAIRGSTARPKAEE